MELSFEQPASLEQRAARKAAIDGMTRALRELWKDEQAAPIPERLLRLLDQLEQPPR
jgi:aminoglycoside phosphotransferase